MSIDRLICKPDEPEAILTRRHWLTQMCSGTTGVALTTLLLKDGLLAAERHSGDDADRPLPHFVPRAKQVIHIYLGGGLSQVDSFDYKPALYEWHGKPMPSDGNLDTFSGNVGLLHQPHYPVRTTWAKWPLGLGSVPRTRPGGR